MHAVPKKAKGRRFATWFKWLMLLGLIVGGGANCWILETTRSRIFSDATTIPENEVGLVLGTARVVGGGKFTNPFFAGRIAAATELFRAGKVRHLLLSGDNHIAGYDEPSDMKAALLAENIPESALTLDYAGFRTLDSMARANRIFGLSRMTVITDDFHAPRAVALGRHFDIETVGYCPPPVPLKWSTKTRVREILARLRTALDLTVLQTKPHFLGEPEPIKAGAADGNESAGSSP